MVARADDASDIHFTIRIPGWLLALVLLALVGWWAAAHRPTSSTRSAVPAMAWVFQQETAPGTWSASVLIESGDGAIEDPLLGWELTDERHAQVIPVAAQADTASAAAGHVIVHLVARLPDGFAPANLLHNRFSVIQNRGAGPGVEVTRE